MFSGTSAWSGGPRRALPGRLRFDGQQNIGGQGSGPQCACYPRQYMRWMIDHYYSDEPMTELDKALFAFASYNAGAETVTYVSNIYKYYIGYRLVMEDRAAQQKAIESVKRGGN